MKHVLNLLGGSLLLAGTVWAQAGLRARSTLAHLTTKGEVPAAYYLDASNSARLGYQVGVFYQVPLSKSLSLVPEVQFSREWV